MTDASRVPPNEGAPLNQEDLLRGIRAAEAEIERLQGAVLSQESLADRLTIAMATPPRSDPVEHGSDLRASVRGLVRRVRRRLGSTQTPSDPGRPPLGDLSLRSESLRGQADSRYPVWIQLYDTVDPNIRTSLRGLLDELRDPPLISVLLPVYNPPEDFLREAIDSVRNQLTPNGNFASPTTVQLSLRDQGT